MIVVSFANARPAPDYFLFDEFVESLIRFGHKPMMLGWGDKWNGLGNKPRLLKAAIDSGRITDERIIVADAFDVVFACSPEVIDEHAREFYGMQIVWNAEKACFPEASLAEKHPQCKSSFRYLNSGFAIGNTADFLALLQHMKADEIPDDHKDGNGVQINPNDQLFYQNAFLEQPQCVPMRLDTHAILCQTLCGVEESELNFDGAFIANRETGSFPCSFHFNGPAKTSGLAEPILRKLGLR